MNIDRISDILSSKRQLSKNQIKNIIQGTLDPRDLLNYHQYDDIFKIRHDAIHWLICEHREIPFGEKHIYELQLSDDVKRHKYYDHIKNQSPDIVIIKGRMINISEITISRMKMPDVPKMSKYKLLVEVLKESGYDVTLEVIVINSAFSIPDVNFLMNEYKFTDKLVDSMYRIIENVENILHSINETDKGKLSFFQAEVK